MHHVSGCNSGLFSPAPHAYETYISTFHRAPQADTWVSHSNENARRTIGVARSARQRPRAPGRLTDEIAHPRIRLVRRLGGTHAFSSVFAYRCCVAGQQFQVCGKPNGIDVARIGVVVSKRIAPRAVDRNYCKRLVRETFQQDRGKLVGFDFVVRLRGRMTASVHAAARAELRELLMRLLRKCRKQSSAFPDHG